MTRTLKTLALTIVAGIGVSACTDYGYGGYGYSSVSVGVGGPVGYAGDWYDPSWGDPYWGWHRGYYYPGTGFYVYDRWRRPHRWNGYHQQYWQNRYHGWRGDRRAIRPYWNDFNRGWRGGGRRGWRR